MEPFKNLIKTVDSLPPKTNSDTQNSAYYFKSLSHLKPLCGFWIKPQGGGNYLDCVYCSLGHLHKEFSNFRKFPRKGVLLIKMICLPLAVLILGLQLQQAQQPQVAGRIPDATSWLDPVGFFQLHLNYKLCLAKLGQSMPQRDYLR